MWDPLYFFRMCSTLNTLSTAVCNRSFLKVLEVTHTARPWNVFTLPGSFAAVYPRQSFELDLQKLHFTFQFECCRETDVRFYCIEECKLFPKHRRGGITNPLQLKCFGLARSIAISIHDMRHAELAGRPQRLDSDFTVWPAFGNHVRQGPL